MQTTEALARELFCRIFCGDPCPAPVPEWHLGIGRIAVQFSGAFRMNMKDDAAPVSVTVAWKDAKGKTAPVQAGTLAFTSDNPDAVAVTDDGAGNFSVGPGPNASTPDADANGVIATVTITATADADLGEGVKQVAAVGAVVLLAGDATTGEITFAPAP